MLDPFYLIVDNSEAIAQLVPLGVKLVQLRIKNKSTKFIGKEIKFAKRICDKYRCQLIINDYWQIALEEGCDFIHLGQEDIQNCDFSKLKNIKLGISTHSLAELDIALQINNLNYIALGPIYKTRLKKMEFAPQGNEKIRLWKQIIKDIDLVAIGGLTPQRAIAALEIGANAAAVVTDISLNANPIERTKEWLTATAKYRIS